MLRNVQIVAVASLLSWSALAQVSHMEKVAKYKELEVVSRDVPGFNLEAYQRELKYEAQNLSLEERAKIETNLLAETVRKQVHELFKNAYERLEDSEEAALEVKAAIEDDSKLLAPEIQDEIRELSYSELERAEHGDGAISSPVNLVDTEKFMLKTATQRSAYLNVADRVAELAEGYLAQVGAASGTVSDENADKLHYNNHQELVNALITQKGGTRWLTRGGWDINLSGATRVESRIAFNFRVEFLGQAVNAGPNLNVKREYTSNLKIIADDQGMVFDDSSNNGQGRFNFLERDFNGKVIMENGKPKYRWAAFACEAILFYEIDLTSQVGFSISTGVTAPIVGGAKAEVNGGITGGKAWRSAVNLQSRRIAVPHTVGKNATTPAYLKDICFNQYPKFKIAPNRTVLQMLNAQLVNVLKLTTLVHKNMNCATDVHCQQWYKSRHLNILGQKAYPRCARNLREKIMNCVIRASRGNRCPVIENGKLVSKGRGEIPCDVGLKCVKSVPQGWLNTTLQKLQYAEGTCQPINPKTYKAPARIR